jgi:hypothetical protein
VPNDNGIFLDLVFTNAPVDVSVACADSCADWRAPLLKLDRHHGHHRAYEIEMRVCYTQKKNHVKFTKKFCELKIHANFSEF